MISRCLLFAQLNLQKWVFANPTFSLVKCNRLFSTESGPLAGVRILDLTRVLAGPFATMLLSDLGATVIKVEKPGSGDDTRLWGPPFVGTESCYFFSVNRNKASIAVDIKSSQGREIIKRLATKCDILMENFTPKTMSLLGLAYDDLRIIAPRLIYLSLSGYGPTGPYCDRPGYDVMAAAVGGLLSVTGPAGGPPCKVGVAMTDLATGLYAHGAVMAALIERDRTGRGQKIDCDLLSTQVACMTNLASNYINGGVEANAYGTAHASIVPYQAFKTKDGYVSIAGNNDAQFAALCQRLQLENLPQNPMFQHNKDRVANRETLLAILQKRFEEKTAAEWLTTFDGAPFPYAPVNKISETFSDPHVVHRKLVVTVEHSTVGAIKVVAPAVQFSESVNKVRGPPPVLGQHTQSVLTHLLGYSKEEVIQFEKMKVVQCAK